MIAPQANRWKLGLFVTLVCTLGVAALVAFGSTKLNRERIDMVTYFDETVQGLDEGSPLKWRGVTIGSVSHIGIAPDRRHVEVHVDVYSDLLRRMGVDIEKLLEPSGDARLRDDMGHDTRVRLVNAGITGLRFLELDRVPG
ncbi:MAG TPA: MlaD family protein, partial [Planctomycetota bacterium]|nr:MlaD family protein [Planctomycetota bacterium]